ncbi:DEAD-box ATP-dependent RNA helicase 1 [Linum perenne]
MGEPRDGDVPVLPWMRHPVDVTQCEECPLDLLPCLDHRLKDALQKAGFSSIFPVQVSVWQETVGPGAFERDLCINSPTGSGKTLAYALPIVQALSTRTVKCLRALVVLPTRDLAFQVKEVFAAIAPAVGLSVGLAVGQSSVADEISSLIKRHKLEAGISYDPDDLPLELQSSVDILVATPGRLVDHITSAKGFTLEHLCYLVVDETDRMLREAYQSWLPTVLSLSRSVEEISVPCINMVVPSTFGPLKTIRRCKTLNEFREGKIQVLVSSDAMTRGMDVEGVRHVVNYDMPSYVKTYIHRAGRTARAGQNGKCFTLLDKVEVNRFKKLLQKAGINSCPTYSIPSGSIESLRAIYLSALGKLKEKVESETSKKRKFAPKSSRKTQSERQDNE